MYQNNYKNKTVLRAFNQSLGAIILSLLLLSARADAATFTVNSTGDASDGNPGNGICDGGGFCTLRAAIEEANALNSVDLIAFNIPVGGVQTIAPLSPLPIITAPLTIDGFTQPGATPNTNPTTQGINAVLMIELNGANAGANADGLRILAGNSIVRGLVINRFSDDGISVNDGDGNLIAGNFIGTDATGTIDLGNGGDGFATDSTLLSILSHNNTIGGLTPDARNIISGNTGNGVNFFFSDNDRVQGNLIGLAADGVTDLGNNEIGVISNFGSTTIGGSVLAARNIISGNRTEGVILQSGGGTLVNIVRGNYLGTDVTGTLDVGNDRDGISINVRANDIIGGTNAGEGNLISGNGGDGLQIGNSNSIRVSGNLIGTKADGTSPLGNGINGIYFLATVANCFIGVTAPNVIAFNSGDGIFDSSGTGNIFQRNSIHSNGGLGIDLGINGVTPNDAGDADTGPNNLQNFPILSLAVNSGSSVTFNGSLNSTANSSFTIDFYAVQTCDASGSGEGQIFLGSTNAVTDGTSNTLIFQEFIAAIPFGYRFSATATDSANNTSEFSPCALVPTTPVSISGRVLTAQGRGVSRAVVFLTNRTGTIRQARTNPFGYYHFADIPAGENYTFSGKHKIYQLVPQTVFIDVARTDIDLIATATSNFPIVCPEFDECGTDWTTSSISIEREVQQ